MKWLPTILIGVAFAFLFQAGVVMSLFLAESRKNIDSMDIASVRLSVVESRTGQMVGSVVGSVIGCCGSCLLLLYLKIRKLEHRILELKSIGCSGPASFE